MTGRRLPRRLHAGAWWIWAMGLAAAASRTTNPILLALILGVVAFVVAARRPPGPLTNAFRGYLIVAFAVIGIRVVFRMLLGGGFGDTILFTLPRLPLPDWATGVVIGGPVTAESVVAALYDGLRLATILVCVGAANTLADPRRLLRSLPRALYDVGAAVAVALSLAPQLVESIRRVNRARRLRGEPGRGLAGLRSLVVPVLGDALDRSIALAAAMDTRGYGRVLSGSRSPRRSAGAVAAVALVMMTFGVFGLAGGAIATPAAIAWLAGGIGAAAAAMALGGRTVGRTVYRPDRWGSEGWLVAGSGLVAAIGTWATGFVDPVGLAPGVQPLVWPTLAPTAAVAILVAAVPAWLAPRPAAAPVELAPAERRVAS